MDKRGVKNRKYILYLLIREEASNRCDINNLVRIIRVYINTMDRTVCHIYVYAWNIIW